LKKELSKLNNRLLRPKNMWEKEGAFSNKKMAENGSGWFSIS